MYMMTFLLLLLEITRKQNWNGYRSRLTNSDKFYIWKRNVKKNLATTLCIASLLRSTTHIQISITCIIQKHPFSSFSLCQGYEHGKHWSTYLFWKVKEKISKQLQTWYLSLCKRALFSQEILINRLGFPSSNSNEKMYGIMKPSLFWILSCE